MVLEDKAIVELMIGIFEEESILAVYVVGQVADGLDAEYLDDVIIGSIIFE